jgi:vitamin B12 transporter
MTSETDGIYDFNSQDRRTELSARSGFSISKSSNLEASLRYSTGKNQFPTDSTGAPVDPNDFRRGSDQVYSVLFGQQINAAFSTQVQYGYNRHDSNTFTIADGIDDFFDSKLRQAESRHYIDWQNNLIAGNNHQLTGGLSFRRESSLTDAYQRRSVGFYIQDQVNLNSRAFLTAGIRYDDNNRFSNFTTGSIDFSFLLIDSLKYRASFGNGFRAPDFAEIEGFPLWGIVGNPNLKPEKNTAFDTGVDFVSPSGSSSLSGTFFYSRFSDLIEFTFLAPPGSPNYLNIEEAESSGFEIEGSHRLNQMLRFGMNYTFTRTEVLDSGNVPGGGFEKGQSLLRRPRHLANLFTVLTQKGYSFRFDLRYKGAREDLQFFPDFSSRRITLPGFWKFDFGATIPLFGFQNEKGTLAAIFRGENLFNSDYQEIAGFQTPGRVLQGGLEVLF